MKDFRSDKKRCGKRLKTRLTSLTDLDRNEVLHTRVKKACFDQMEKKMHLQRGVTLELED